MRIDSPQSLGRAVRAVRKQLGLTQPDLAMTAGTSLRFIVEVEKGKPTCQIGKVLTVLATLGIALDLSPPSGVTVEPAPSLGKGPPDATDA
ncbi:MAG: helix-turn-helix transcriptional regulator [Alphaproteobacteria bacterium]|nr:helix-turn-helix transcriptional regulator [Alphaproteobacteria bacterium]